MGMRIIRPIQRPLTSVSPHANNRDALIPNRQFAGREFFLMTGDQITGDFLLLMEGSGTDHLVRTQTKGLP